MKRIILVLLVFIGFIGDFALAETSRDNTVIAILQEDFPSRPSYANPVKLKSFLDSKGMPCELISADILSDGDAFNNERYNLVILPYGACFPLKARDSFIQYLKQGGAFVSMGGYAFDDLMEKKEGKWVKIETDDPSLFLSGRRGKPGDWVKFQPDQIVVFDPTYPFKRTTSIAPDPSSPIETEAWSAEINLEGFAATAMTGSNSPVFPDAYADWHPLVTAYDRYGRPRGSVFSLAVHHDGPYRGSAWAFSGVTNVNLFDSKYPQMMDALYKTVRMLSKNDFPKPKQQTRKFIPANQKISVSFDKNYFQINGKPTFLFGSNQTGVMWYSPRENEETWHRDFSRMRDCGLRVLRILHFSPFGARGREGKAGHSALNLAKRPPEKTIEQTDRIVDIAARYGVAIILTLHDWIPVELTDEELEAQRTWARFWVNRYKDKTNIFYDIQNEPSINPEKNDRNNRFWNSYLKELYGNDAALREAWGSYSPKEALGEIPCGPGPDEWDNPRAFDYTRFRSWMVERWIEGNIQGIREGDADAMVTVGFLQREWPADKFLPTQELTFSNTHYHGPFERFSPIFKLTDRRFRGQGLSVGEYGAWDAHEARSQGLFRDETRASIRHFLAIGHDALGMGGAFALNWDLKELDDCVFPWGLTYAQDAVPKDWLCAYRNMSAFFQSFRPRYESPELFFVIPDNHRLGAKAQAIYNALHNALHMMFACHVNFGVINETSVNELPSSAKTLLWPIPYCPSDSVFETMRDFVKRGGNLYFSGGIGFDVHRRPTKEDRYAQLGLSIQEMQAPFAKAITEEKQTLVYSNVGKGKVAFLPNPIEFAPFDRLSWNPYSDFLNDIGQDAIQCEPNDTKLHLFSIPETNGNRIYTLYRNERDENLRVYNVTTNGGDVSLALEGYETGLVELTPNGEIVSIEGTGEIQQNESAILKTDAHIMAQSADERPILKSKRLCIFPNRSGSVRIKNESLKNPCLWVGEIVNGKWVNYERIELKTDDGWIQFDIDPDRATCLLLLKESTDGFTIQGF